MVEARGTEFELCVGPVENPDRYGYGKIVGSGSEGELHEGVRYSETVGATLDVAVKEIRTGDLVALESRFRDQAAVLSRIGHVGIVNVEDCFLGAAPHHVGVPPGPADRLYLVMKWISGPNLRDWLDANPALTPRQRLGPLVQIASALDALHSGSETARPIVHGDVKPENIVYHPTSGPVLVDFGLARADGQAPPSRAGSGGYRAPEVLTDGRWSAASDRYALGALAVFLLSGQDIPTYPDLVALRAQLLAQPDLRNQETLVAGVLAMLDPNPALRPPSAVQWANSLRSSISSVMDDGSGLQPVVAANATPYRPTPPPKKTNRGRTILGVCAALIVVALLGAGYIAFEPSDDVDASGTTTEATTTTASTTTLPPTTTTASTTTLPPTTTTASTTTVPVPLTSPTVLTADDLVNYDGNRWRTSDESINGNYSAQTLYSGWCQVCLDDDTTTSFVEFNLERKYSRFHAIVGQLDDSIDSTGVFRFEVKRDGVVVYSKDLPLGSSDTIDLDMTDTLRVQLSVTRLSDRVNAHTGWGDPTVQ